MTQRPPDSEYAPYFARYIDLVPAEEDVLAVLARQMDECRNLAVRVTEAREHHRYAPGKWSVREVMGHLGDAERVFGYRAAGISRGDATPFPSFDENLYVANGGFDEVSLATLTDEFLHLRAAHLSMFRRLPEPAWTMVGTASGKHVSVRALAYIMAGHVVHHVNILRERYEVG